MVDVYLKCELPTIDRVHVVGSANNIGGLVAILAAVRASNVDVIARAAHHEAEVGAHNSGLSEKYETVSDEWIDCRSTLNLPAPPARR